MHLHLVNLLDVGPAAAAAALGHAAGHAAGHATHAAAAALRVHGGHDRRADALGGLGLVVGRDLVLDLLVVEGGPHRVAVVLERVLGLHLLLRQPRLVVGDGDLVLLARRLLERGDVEHAVRVNVEGYVDLRHAARHGRDAREVELAELVVVLRARALALEDLDR